MSLYPARVNRVLFAILLLAFALRAGYSLVGLPIRFAIDPSPLGTDHYETLAREWLSTGHYDDMMRGPLYPAFLAGVFWISHDSDTVARLVQAILDTVTCLLIFLFARQVLKIEAGARIAALMYALYYPMINLTSKYATETLHVFLTTLFLWSFWAVYCRPTAIGIVRMGFVLGLMLLVRQDALLFPIIVCGLLILAFKFQWKQLIAGILLFLLALAVVVAPRAVQVYQITGQLSLTGTGNLGSALLAGFYYDPWIPMELQDEQVIPKYEEGINALLSGSQQASIGDREKVLLAAFWSRVTRDPLDYMTRVFSRVIAFWFLDFRVLRTLLNIMFQLPLLLLAIYGARYLVSVLRQPVAPLIAWVLYLNLLFAVSLATLRYSMPAIPVVLVLAAGGWQSLRYA